MPILVSTKDEDLIEVSIKYVDIGKKGCIVFDNEEEIKDWSERRKSKDKSVKVKELKSWWKRTDWATQGKIVNDSQFINDKGESEIDWVKYRFSQMSNLLIKWSLKDKEGNQLPVNDKLISRLDYNVAIALLAGYDREITSTEEEIENFE